MDDLDKSMRYNAKINWWFIEEIAEPEKELLLEDKKEVANAAPKPQPHQEEEEDEEDSIEYQSETVLTILKPVAITMIFVVWAVKTITLPGRGQVRCGVA